MKALSQKGWLGTACASGAIGVHDGFADRPLPVMDWAHLELPPYLRCASERCQKGQACMGDALQTPCLARPANGVNRDGQTFYADDDGTRTYIVDEPLREPVIDVAVSTRWPPEQGATINGERVR